MDAVGLKSKVRPNKAIKAKRTSLKKCSKTTKAKIQDNVGQDSRLMCQHRRDGLWEFLLLFDISVGYFFALPSVRSQN